MGACFIGGYFLIKFFFRGGGFSYLHYLKVYVTKLPYVQSVLLYWYLCLFTYLTRSLVTFYLNDDGANLFFCGLFVGSNKLFMLPAAHWSG